MAADESRSAEPSPETFSPGAGHDQEWFQAVFRASLDAIGIGHAGRIVVVNQTYLELFGYTSLEEVVGQSILERIAPAERPRVQAQIQTRVAGDQAPTRYETRGLRHDGTEFALAAQVSTFEQAGAAYTVAILRDLTELRQSEEARLQSEGSLSAVLENAFDSVLSVDREYRLLTINAVARESFRAVLGVELQPGMQIMEILPDELKTLWKARYDRALGGEHFVVEDQYMDGLTKFYGELSMTPIREGERITGVSVFSRDITARKLNEMALRRAQKMEAVGRLTGGIAHDFNNLLGIILGNVELLADSARGRGSEAAIIADIENAAVRATELTQQLLSFSRDAPQKVAVVDLNQSIRSMSRLIARALSTDIAVRMELGDGVWLTEIDPGDFENALLNLIINARDAMSGSGAVFIETSNASVDEDYCQRNPGATVGDYVQVVVRDTGHGIPAETLDRIFEPFFTTKPKPEGTGLGLAMVFGFVQRSRGHIRVESSPEGSSLCVCLPRTQRKDPVSESPSSALEDLPTGTEQILVVDDEAALVEVARAYLERLGYRVVTAEDGPSALRALEANPDTALLFTDVVMPGGLNGYQLAAEAVARFPALRVMLTSGFSGNPDLSKSERRFADSLLPKPYTLADVARPVRATLDGQGPTASH